MALSLYCVFKINVVISGSDLGAVKRLICRCKHQSVGGLMNINVVVKGSQWELFKHIVIQYLQYLMCHPE